ncbi:MAG: hypothetical protein LBJ90_01310 [Treponema sp.]|jgi:hypothetical protein|nr:hypothetical protein [Treponema sp.]
MNNTRELLEERKALREDLLAGKKPKRVLAYPRFTLEAGCGLTGTNLMEAHYNTEQREKAYDGICKTFYSDTLPIRDTRYPGTYQLLGAKNWILASGGAVQHPEIETMRAEEYDEFIAAPCGVILEKFLPRVCTALEGDPVNRGLTLAAAFGDYCNQERAQALICEGLNRKYGYCAGFITNQRILAPFDFLADQLRGFKSITMDIRRVPDKIKAALEVITPLMIKMASPAVRRPGLISLIPLHLAPFINMKQFEELYWPSLEKTVVELDRRGVACMLQVEQDCTRYAEYFARLPASTLFMIESGDPARFTETLGKDHVFGGFYDPTITLTRGTEECIDEAKRLLEICMKSDHAYFIFDRVVMDIKSVNVSRLRAVLEWVRDNAEY